VEVSYRVNKSIFAVFTCVCVQAAAAAPALAPQAQLANAQPKEPLA